MSARDTISFKATSMMLLILGALGTAGGLVWAASAQLAGKADKSEVRTIERAVYEIQGDIKLIRQGIDYLKGRHQ